jgi:hypothetical protein
MRDDPFEEWRDRLTEWSNTMRSVLVLGLLITLCASANAATVHRSKPPEGHLRPGQRVTVPTGYAVPGWTDEQTRKWLYNGSSASGLG